MAIKLGFCGYTGKLCQSIITIINNSSTNEYLITGLFNSKNSVSDLEVFCENSDIVLDFSTPNIVADLLYYATKSRTKLVIGTTGLAAKHFSLINKASKLIPILYTENTSIGMNLISIFSAKIAAILKEHDVGIIDIHHKQKRDSPSGTSFLVADSVLSARINKKNGMRFTKCDQFKKKLLNNNISLSSIRAGGVTGIHSVLFADDNELIEIKHQFMNRSALANGALIGARWINSKSCGLYYMNDLIQDLYNV
ncbi:4-hydroxy-tetrahydrodipicolinate reductase [Rickettsia endosymbiont of Cardiosporidium cionae]|uniref:4-hydroxy-tetrahydrodipicolinate reductase n=1 Tax=Rickettsia endosymbiont of Cardiosporidium cionae TaxID=2777155 RepID=UPI001895D1A8|nr:4-hydroxy-tetrahydrodipicolinate reductase [Rickettsia endosymbiont of Cardiosporidium cionae]KAF8818953.1 4-hydroxy-tetrahydrodipicolinate reductase [Rickettsia endosymbiont of Cardiosporidium cionae]